MYTNFAARNIINELSQFYFFAVYQNYTYLKDI